MGFSQTKNTPAQGQDLIVAKKYKDRARKIQVDNTQPYGNPSDYEIVKPEDPDFGGGGGGLEPGWHYVTFPVYTDGYLVEGAVSGIMASGYNQFNQVAELNQNKIRKGSNIVVTATPGLFGLVHGPSITTNYSWEFSVQDFFKALNISTAGVFKYHFTYHHGYNTISNWTTVSIMNLNDKAGRFLDTLTKTATQGGNYYRESGTFRYEGIPSLPRQGFTYVTAKDNLPFIGKGDCYLEKVELLYCPNPSSLTNKTISFSQFYETVPSNENINISLPGVGLLDYGCDFVPGTTSFQNLSVSKHTQVSYMIAYISDSELDQDFGGSEAIFAGMMTNAMSTYMNPYPSRAVAQADVTNMGAKTYFSAIIQ